MEFELKEVSFTKVAAGQGWDVKKDDGSGDYTAPHWKDSPKRRYPYLYKQGVKLKIANAKWKNDDHEAGNTYKVRGTGPDGIEIPETVATPAGANIFEINNVTATVAFAANKVKFYNTFDIDWEVSCDDGPWESAGTSKNPIYVCLSGSPSNDHYRTVVHLACSNDGATTPDAALLKTWDLLKGPANFKGWDETAQSFSRKLYYYRPGFNFNCGAGSVEALLQDPNSNGQCSTWARLMEAAVKLNGATPTYVFCVGTVDPVFLVKDWIYAAVVGAPPWNFDFFAGPNLDMVPVPPGGVYGDLTNQATLRGQNSAPPAEKVFGNHQFLKYTNTSGVSIYYDASYGVTYNGVNKAAAEADFQAKAVDGYGNNILFPNAAGNVFMDVRKPGAAVQVAFSA